MLKVRLTTGRVGIGADGVPWQQAAGDLVELPRREAVRLVEAQQAEAFGWSVDKLKG